MRYGLSGLVALSFLASMAAAEEIVFEFTGEVRQIDGPLPAPFGDVQVGDPYTFTYTFDSEAVDLEEGDPNSGVYGAILAYELRVGDAEQTGAPFPLNYITVLVDSQRYGAFATDLFVDLTMVAVVDFEPGTFETDALPLSLEFDRNIATDFQFGGSDGFADCTITGYRRIGGVECGAIRKFKVKCRGGKLTAKIASGLEEGTALTLDNNGDQKAAVVNRAGKAKAKWKHQTGEHTVAIVECPEHTKVVECR